MNARSYKTVFSKRLGALVAVGEHASSQGKANGAGSGGGAGASGTLGYIAALTASFAFVSLAWAAPASNALPTAGQVVQGAASMSQTASQMTINQATQRAAINWQSFNIGAQAKVQVVQPNAQAVLLNRVVGQSPSQIFGQLQANGHVILVNPNGVLFGKDGSVNAGGFTASTLNISDANFMAGNMVYERNGSTAGIVNEGKISTEPGGYVALLGATVSNEGSITTKGGSVVMGAGETIKVPVSGTGRIKLELTPAAINASVSNSGSIVTEGGQVYMQALALNRAAAQILQSGSIDTTGEKGGAVNILADGGRIRVSGSIKANSTNGTAGGDVYIGRDKDTNVLASSADVSGAKFESLKGFVETSGDELKFDGVSVAAKDWLLDPFNVNIDAASAATIGSNLATTSITIETTSGSSPGLNTAGTGNITISSAITKATGTGAETTLRLIADNGIDVNAAIGTAAGAGAGKLNVEMTAKGQTNGKAVADMSSAERALSSGIRINSSINANGGNVTLTGTSYANSSVQVSAVGKGVLIHNGASIRANDIKITGTADNQSGNTSYGVVFQRYPTAATLTATGDIEINGTLKGFGNGSAVFFNNSGWGAQAPMITAGGTFSINAKNQTPNTNTSAALDVLSGMQVTAKGNIKISAETNTVTANAINIVSNNASVWGNALLGNTSLRSIDSSGAASGNILIQANQGGINLNNGITPTLTSGSLTAKTDIVGKNITIDNTGGIINLSTGAITQGNGKATGTGITINDTRAINASGNVNIMGASSGAGSGVATKATMIASGNVNVTGESVNGKGVITYGAINATGGDVKITGTSTGSLNTASALSLQGAITAQKNVTLTGSNTNALNPAVVAYLNKNITATTGKIDINTSTAGTTANALQLAAGANLSAMTEVNIKADTLTIDTTGASISATSTGTVTIKTDSSDAKIKIGALDAGSATTSNRTLGLLNAELNRITAGNLVIGDASNTGGITVSATTTTTTNASTGNITLLTAGNIAVNRALTVGGTNNLTLNGAGANSAITQTAAIKAAGLELLGTNATHTLTNADNDIKKLAGDTKTVSLTNQGNLTVGVVNATTGLTAANDIKLTTTTATGTALTISNDIKSANGDVSLIAVTSDTNSAPNAAVLSEAHVQGRDVTMSAKAQGLSGRTLGYRGTTTGKFTASNDLTLIGSTQNEGSGLYMYGGALAAGNALTIEGTSAKGQGVGFDKAPASSNVNIASGNGITIKGTASNSTSTAPQAAINLKDVDLTNSAGAVTLEALKGDITTGGTGKLTQNGNGDVKLTTVDHGNIFVPKIINKGTGNVVIAAGSDLLAGNGSGGQVKTFAGNTITQTNAAPGNTYIYSGSAANTDLLSRLDNSFSELRLSGDMGTPGTPLAQNADSNVKYAAGTTITGGAKAQVMFREKIALNTSTITGATLVKTYGDANTKNISTDQPALFAEMQAQLKQTNPGQIITRSLDGTNGAGEFKISKAALINDFSGSLNTDATSFSNSTHLTAKTHEYGALTSTKYDATLAAGAAKVEVAKLALTGSIAQSNSIYGDSLVAGTASFTNKVGSDVVNLASVNIATAGNTSGSGNLNAGTYAGIQSVSGLTGADAANYSFTNVKGDYKVDQRPLTIAPGSVATKTADGTTAATVTPGALSNLVGTETLGVAATGTFSDANAGNNKAVNAFYTLQNGANGGVASNYILALGKPGNPDTRMTGTILASINPVTPIAPVNNNTGSVSRVRTVSGFGNSGAATGVLDDTPVTESREVCSDVFPENCECQPSVIPSVEICFVPKRVAATKEEK